MPYKPQRPNVHVRPISQDIPAFSHTANPGFRNAYYAIPSSVAQASKLHLLTKLSFVWGTFLMVFPILLRMLDFVDNSTAFSFIAIGMLLVIIGEGNRARIEDTSTIG